MRKLFLLLMCITIQPNIIHAQSEYFPVIKGIGSIWEAESLFLGATIQVIDSSSPLIVIRKPAKPRAAGIVYLMIPEHQDSAVQIFHNDTIAYPAEADTVNLGTYSAGTEIIFRYMCVDTSQRYNYIRNKKIYSGRNRDSLDLYTSEISGCSGKRWAIAGAISPTVSEISFDGSDNCVYKDIRFFVVGTKIVK